MAGQAGQPLRSYLRGLDEDDVVDMEYADLLHEKGFKTPAQVKAASEEQLQGAGIRAAVINLIKKSAAVVNTPATTWATLQAAVAAERNFTITPVILDAMRSYSVASGRWTAWELLQQHWPPANTFHMDGRSTHDSSTRLDPHAIGDWDITDQEIDKTLWPLLTVSVPLRMNVGSGPSSNEAQSNTTFLVHILNDANAAFEALSDAGLLAYHIRYSIDEEALNNSAKPDFVGTISVPQGAHRTDSFVFAVGGGKKVSVLEQSYSRAPALLSLKDAYLTSNPPQCRTAVGQLNGYVDNETHTQNSNPPRALFLTTCETTWILQRDAEQNILYMAKGRTIASTNPSVRQHMAYLALKFADDAVRQQRVPFPAGSVTVGDPSRPTFSQRPNSGLARSLVLRPARRQEQDSQGGSQQKQQLALLPFVLGSGASCVVHLGRWGPEDVAIKVFPPRSTHVAQREVAIYDDLHLLQGRFIPRLLDYGWFDESFHIVLQRAPGLHPHKLGYHVTEKQLLSALQALRAMHDAGRLHNDLHTDNIMIDETTDKVMLLDPSESTRWTDKAQCRLEEEQLASTLWYCASQSREPISLPSGSAHPLPHWLPRRPVGSMPAALLAGF